MSRHARTTLAGIVALVAALCALLPATPVAASAEREPATATTLPSDDGAPADDADTPAPSTRPPVTVSDFFPEDANLSDCVGLVERPGCGSEARGGWRQTLVFVILAVGLALVFWRISVGVRRNRASTRR